MRPSREQYNIRLVATLLAVLTACSPIARAQNPPAPAPTPTSEKPASGFSVQTPPQQPPPAQPQQNLIPVLPMPMGNLGQPQQQQSTRPNTFLAPAPNLPPLSGVSEVQAYDPGTDRRPALIFKTSEGEFKLRFNTPSAGFNF